MSNSLLLLYTYGVLERVSNMVSSAAEKELEKVKRIFSDLRKEYSSIFECITSVRDEEVGRHLKQLRAIAYDVENLVAIKQFYSQEKDVRSHSLWFTLIRKISSRKYRVSRKLDDSITRLKQSFRKLKIAVRQHGPAELQSRSFCIHPDTFALSSLSRGASSRYYGQIWSLPDDYRIFGLHSNKDDIIRWIFKDKQRNQHPKVISICGEAGSGKTTLAKMIYNDAAVQESTCFDLLSWALAPPTHPDLKDTLVEIIRSFTNQSQSYLQGLEVDTLKHTLHGILKDQKYLLVVDGFYKREGLGELMEIFEVGLAGSTVILVSAYWMTGAGKRWEVQGLAESDSWSLFAQCAGFYEEAEYDHPSSLTSIGRSIVDTCHGSPRAIKTLGSILRTNRHEHSWQQIRDRITGRAGEHNRFRNLSRYDSTEAFAFTLSLEHMGADLLQCLYVSLFLSKSMVMPKEQLIFHWMAMGFLHSRNGNEDPIDVGNRYCDELALRCFIQLFQSDGRSMVLLHKQVASLRWILREVELSPYLILRGDVSLMDLGSASTRVLLLDGSEFGNLPETIGGLKLLRHLSLAGNNHLTSLPDSICNLRNLQTLDLSGCEQLQTLPKNMAQLVSLRHLFLSINLTNVPDIALRSSASLHYLRICNSPNLNSLSEKISQLTALKVLQVHECPSIASLPNSIKGLTSLIELSILNCEMLDLTNWDGLKGLRGLRYLQIQGLPKLSKLPEGIKSAANSLQHLVVSNCQNFAMLPEGLQNCRKLVEMVIENCPKLNTSCQRGVGDDWRLISHIPKFQLIQYPVYQQRAAPAWKDHIGSAQRLDRPEYWGPGEERMSDDIQQESFIMSKGKDDEWKDPRSVFFLLPEDYEIEKDTLIQLWMAVEHVSDEQHGEKCFSDVLREKYLLLCGTNFMTGKARYRINTEKMNELLVSQKHNASSYLQWKKEYLNNIIPGPRAESIRYVSLGSSAEIDATTFETLEKFTQLRSLLFLGNHGHGAIHMPSRLFSSFKQIEALDLSGTHMKELPSSIGHMTQLRYLDLSWTLIKLLPDKICTLTQLQTLKLTYCLNLRELPGELKMLTKLRHIDVDVLGQLKSMPSGIGALVNLRTLSAFLVGTQDGNKIQELEKLDNLTDSFCIANLEHVKGEDEARGVALCNKKGIEKLELRWTPSELSGNHKNSDAILELLQPSTSVKELRILCYEGLKFPSWVSNPGGLNNIVSITFYKCEKVSELPSLEHLPLLKYLDLTKMNSIMKIERCHQRYLENHVAYNSLERLEIDEMQNLKTFRWQSRNGDDFRSLVELTITDCPQLEEFDLPPHLSAIKRLEITECPKFPSLSDTELPPSLQEVIIEGRSYTNPKANP